MQNKSNWNSVVTQGVAATVICLTLGTLGGCGSNQSLPQGETPAAVTASIEEIRAMLAQAQTSTSPQKERLLLQAAGLLNQRGENDWARNLLSSLNLSLLDEDDYVQYTLLFSAIAMEDDAYFLAQRILTNRRLEQQWQLLPDDIARTLGMRRAALFSLLGESTASVKERIRLSSLLSQPEDEESNQDAIWQTLMSMPEYELQQLSRTEEDALLRGWYSLAALSKNNQTDLERQQAQVDRWIASWPEHPASLRLPHDLQLLRQLIDEKPQQLALLLPQKGKLAKAGKSIRDGFFAAYYQAMEQQSRIPDIRLYDSSQGNIESLYQQAVNEGAQLVIGPLDKDKVAELNLSLELPVPVLAMNYIEPLKQEVAIPDSNNGADAVLAEPGSELPGEYVEGLYQFGLAVEDEARQAARRAWLEGHRHAMILAPATDWGQRSARAFITEWQALGGDLAGNHSFSGSGDFSKVIKNALLVQQSQDRARQLRRLFGHNLEFEPRRRQDLDMIFLVASPTQARQIKPTLAFHYAGKLPVYATSHIYTGQKDSKSNRDLNGIKFSSLPWVFDQSSAEKQTINRFAQVEPAYSRLYALGVDAYRLHPRLKQLHQVPGARLYGATGALRLTPDRRVEREQMWAQIRGGIAHALPLVVSGEPLR